MKNNIYLVISFLVCSVYSLYAQDSSKKEFNVTGYTTIKTSGAVKVYITFTDKNEKVVVETSSKNIDNVEVSVSDKSLNLGMKKVNTNIGKNNDVKIYVFIKSLEAVKLSGSTFVQFENSLQVQSFLINSSGASNLRGELYSEELKVSLSGASNVTLKGNSYLLKADLSGASNFSDYNFHADEGFFELSGASSCKLFVDKELSLKASGASALHYKGNPTIKQEKTSGAASLNNKN